MAQKRQSKIMNTLSTKMLKLTEDNDLENLYKRGKFDIDIQKCLTREDGTYTYTSEGVQFDHTLIEKFTDKVQLYQSISKTKTKTTSDVMRMSMAYTFIKGINELGSIQ